MDEPGIFVTPSHERSQWVRLRTFVLLRWVAITGQLVAVVAADWLLNLSFNTGLCFLVISAAIIANLLALFLYPENKRLNEVEATANLVFDVSQLSLLLFLTGGLHNPFSLMVLAPVAIGATALKLRSILVLGAVTLILITAVGVYHLPLRTAQGFILRIPIIFEIGFWVAITTGVVFLAALIRQVTNETHAMGDALMATQMALAREQKLTDLGGVVAAAAHELGTPLATIKLVSTELAEELEDGSSLHEDAILLGQQADRCRDILRAMGRSGNDDLHMRNAPMSALIEEAAEPHATRGKTLHFQFEPEAGASDEQPVIRRAPEILHGVRNLIQNAVDFADGNVWIDVRWNDDRVTLWIADDGQGFPAQLIGRIGDPFMRTRSRKSKKRPGYEGMGLGLFIAKTLLERSGAELTFANGSSPFLTAAEHPDRRGAIVVATWARDSSAMSPERGSQALGENQPILG